MKEEKLKVNQNAECRCPFCDEPMCPDPEDSTYRCSIDREIKIHPVDCVGLYCPMPVMRAKEEIDQLKPGELMELIADDPASLEDMKSWAKRSGHQLLKVTEDGQEYRFVIQKKEEE